MGQNTVSQLPSETVKLITSTQIITSVSTAVKELVENSIDAGAKVIQIRLENFGLDLIEVKDDGFGVSYDNVQKMFLPGYTSKIRQFEDLDQLYSYGFRGEALAALVKVAKVSITTKTMQDTLAMTYDIDSTGFPVSSKPSHLNKGTAITVTGLFSNLPVRRLYLSSKKKMTEEIKKVEQVVQSLSLIHSELGVSLIHNKCPIWKKNSVKGIKQSFMQVAGLKTVSKLDHINKLLDQVNIDLIIPKKDIDNPDNVFTNSPNSIYVYINKRPVNCKILSQPVQEHIFHCFSTISNSFKYSVCLISVNVPPDQIDINLEPNKTKVILKNQKQIIKILDETLSDYYCHENFKCTAIKEPVAEENIEDEPEGNQRKRPRLESDTSKKIIGEKRTQEFKEKNKDWNLEIINDDCAISCDINKKSVSEKNNSGPQSLCSQINSENCILTTEKEVSELNAILNDTYMKLVTSTNNKNCETRLIDRDDIQGKKAEKPILPDWPSRPKVTQPEPKLNELDLNKCDFSITVSTPSEILNKIVEGDSRPKDVIEPESKLSEVDLDKCDFSLTVSTPTEILNEIVGDDCRPKDVIEPESKLSEVDLDKCDFSLTVSTPSEILNKIVATQDIEKEAEKWSDEIINAMRRDTENETYVEEYSSTLLKECEKFDCSMQSVSSQMGKKEMKAFTKFARIMRPKIIEEFPNIPFTQVANILAERWKNLSPDEIKYYQKMADVVDINRKNYQEEKKNQIPKIPEKPVKQISNNRDSLKNLFEKIKKKNHTTRPFRKEILLQGSFKDVRKLRNFHANDSGNCDIRIIGQLQPSGNWLYIKQKEIGHIRHQGLQELIVSQKMLSNHSISKKVLETPILITREIIGDTLWEILCSLDSEFNSKSLRYTVTNDLITKNGFLVEIDNNKETHSGRIIEVADSIPNYGISDMKDILRLYEKNGEIGGLASWRPTSVVDYITNEAIRLVQKSEKSPNREEIEDMINTYHLCLKHLPPLCLHSREIFVPFFKLENSLLNTSTD